MFERLREWWRRHIIDDEPVGYDRRPVYDIPPEDDPGIGGVPRDEPPDDIVGKRDPDSII